MESLGYALSFSCFEYCILIFRRRRTVIVARDTSAFALPAALGASGLFLSCCARPRLTVVIIPLRVMFAFLLRQWAGTTQETISVP